MFPVPLIDLQLAVRFFQRSFDTIRSRFELLLQIVQCGPRLGDIRPPFSLEAFKFGVR